MNNHTPGPWAVTKHATPAYAPQFGVYAEGSPHDLATVTGENSEADAALIAAAPDMHDALKHVAQSDEVMLLLQRVIDGNGRHICGNIRDALAKAEGSRMT